jgi:hypothetical protein
VLPPDTPARLAALMRLRADGRADYCANARAWGARARAVFWEVCDV